MDRQKEKGGKLCLHCMRSIPLLAGRCPYCLEEDQGVHGRFFLVLLVLVIIVADSFYYKAQHSKSTVQQENTIQSTTQPEPPQKTRSQTREEIKQKLRELTKHYPDAEKN